jgi:hypothetical protein
MQKALLIYVNGTFGRLIQRIRWLPQLDQRPRNRLLSCRDLSHAFCLSPKDLGYLNQLVAFNALFHQQAAQDTNDAPDGRI